MEGFHIQQMIHLTASFPVDGGAGNAIEVKLLFVIHSI